MQTIPNFGILASVSWNSRHWKDYSTDEDVKNSMYKNPQESGHLTESLNFGQEIYPAEADGYYIGYIPKFDKAHRSPSINVSKSVQIVFLRSKNYNGHVKYVIGFYGFPIFGEVERYTREANHVKFKSQFYNHGNIKSFVQDIVYFDNYLPITDESLQKLKILPEGKIISYRGFNYLDSNNAKNLLKKAIELNPENQKLKHFITNMPLEVEARRTIKLPSILKEWEVDTLRALQKANQKWQELSPIAKKVLSKRIERGPMGNRVKRHNNFKCQICEAMGNNPYTFKKPKPTEEYYVEAHHVEPVSNPVKGVLGAVNIITVCANHHRQLHYGGVPTPEQDPDSFFFQIDGKRLQVKKMKIPVE